MTKLEALAKDCIENHTHRLVDKPTKQDIYLREESIFIQGYRQSEKRIAELVKENAELDCQKNRNKACYSCANVTERCFKNEIGCPCEKYKSYKDENAQLKNRNSELAGQKASLERWYGEAKEIIKGLLDSCFGYYSKTVNYEVKAKAELFLKEE